MTSLALAETRVRQFLALAKPRVVSLIVFCAVIGMFLATPDLPPPLVVFAATVGIASFRITRAGGPEVSTLWVPGAGSERSATRPRYSRKPPQTRAAG